MDTDNNFKPFSFERYQAYLLTNLAAAKIMHFKRPNAKQYIKDIDLYTEALVRIGLDTKEKRQAELDVLRMNNKDKIPEYQDVEVSKDQRRDILLN